MVGLTLILGAVHPVVEVVMVRVLGLTALQPWIPLNCVQISAEPPNRKASI